MSVARTASTCSITSSDLVANALWVIMRRTHEEHVDLVGQQAVLAGRGQEHEGELADLGHAQTHRQRRARWVPEHPHHAPNLDRTQSTTKNVSHPSQIIRTTSIATS